MADEQQVPERRSFTVCKIGGPLQQAPILHWITGEEVGIRMGLNSFINALVSEVGSPALVMTQEQLRQKLLAASERIVNQMKQSTAGS